MSDSDIEDPRTIGRSKGNMKSLFASDRAATSQGSQSLKYEGAKKKDAQQGGTTIACQAPVQCYRGDQQMGTCSAVVAANPQQSNIIIVDRDKRPLGRVKIDAQTQLIQNPTEMSYATLYDPSVQQHWTLQFRSPQECTKWVVGALTVQHYIMLADGPVPPYTDVAEGQHPVAKKKDSVQVAYTVWVMQRVGQTATFVNGKNVEEVPREAPKQVKLGSNTIMQGIEELLVSMGSGARRIGWLPPKKTKISGLGNPEITPQDSVVVIMEVISVERDAGDMPDLGSPTDAEGRRARGASKKGSLDDVDDDEDLTAPQRRSAAPKEEPKAAAPAPVTPTAPAAGATDTNALLHAVLLQQLTSSKPAAPEPQPVASSGGGIDVERSIDRVHQQIASLYEKIDRIDIDSKLKRNNEVIERIVKKAVGKMPVNDVDVEDMAKDRDQLLAAIEKYKGRLQEMTDNYHKALETLGRHNAETSGLKNDLLIERETAAAKIKELNERRRLELVDSEVKHRRELDAAIERTKEEAHEQGYKRGYEAGKIDALEVAGSSDTQQLKEMLSKKEHEIVALQSEISQMQSKHYEERRDFNDQIASLNNLIRRLEAHDTGSRADHGELTTQFIKTLRRTMNATYASIEEQFYATEQDNILVQDALGMVLVSVKSETRETVNALKAEAEAELTRPHKPREQPEAPDAYVDPATGVASVKLVHQAEDDHNHASSAALMDTHRQQMAMENAKNGADDILKYLAERDGTAQPAEEAASPTADDVIHTEAPHVDLGDLPPPPAVPMDSPGIDPEVADVPDIDPSWLPSIDAPAAEEEGAADVPEFDAGALPPMPGYGAPEETKPEDDVVQYAEHTDEFDADEDGRLRRASPKTKAPPPRQTEDIDESSEDESETPPPRPATRKAPKPKKTQFTTSSDDDSS